MAKSNFIVRGGLDMSSVTKGLQQSQKQFASFQSSISKSLGFVKTALAGIAIGSLVKDSLAAASTLESAMMGLTSIVSGQGRDVEKAKGFIQSYVKDGLVPLADAVTAYKTLAMRGYSDNQIETIMNRLKDAAAFGRQSSLTLGEAVKSATEGLKNENSILVDNSGITKNVSLMWADYAKQLGKGVKSLTLAEKRQAEVNGIMAETQFQVGDAAKYADTYQGRLSALNKTLTDIKVNLGNAFMPIANVVIPILQNLGNKLSVITSNIAAFSQALFGKAIIASTKNTTDTTEAIEQAGEAAKEAGKKASKAVAPFDELIKISSGTSGSGSGAGSTTSTTETSSATNEATENTNNFASAAEKLKKKLKPLTEAIEKLGEKLKPFSVNMGEGLKWFNDKVLTPMSEIVISETVPNVLYAIGSAIGLINTAVDKFQENKGKDTILGFLQSLQEAKIKKVSDFFKKIGDAFTALDNFIQKPNWEDLWKYIKNALSISFDIEKIPDFTDPFKAFGIPDEIAVPVKAIIATTWEMLKGKWDKLIENFKPVVVKFTAVVATTAAFIKQQWDKLATEFKPKVAAFTITVLTIVSTIKSKWEALSKEFKAKQVDFTVKVLTLAKDIYTIGQNLIKEFIKGFMSIAMPKIKIKTEYDTTGIMSNVGKVLGLPGWPKLSLGFYENGGFPDTGSLFVANEAGPELVGRIGGKTAVANQDQIVDALASGIYAPVFNAVVAAMSKYSGGSTLNIDSEEFTRATNNGSTRHNRRQSMTLEYV